MPSENAPTQRPGIGGHRSTSSVHSQTTDSPPSTPPQQNKQKGQKHVVGRQLHTRVPSNKGLHKLTKVHGNEGSHTDLKKLTKNSSGSNLKKNSSHTSLKRNRSSADVSKKVKEAHLKRPASVHFEIGDQDQDQDQEDGWEEASSSASPALSRSASRPGSSNQSSAKHSANNSQPVSPTQVHTSIADGANERQSARHTADDGKIIAERLLQRTPSHNTTKMSLATATPTSTSQASDRGSSGSTLNETPKIGSKDEVVSRFVGGSGTPSENSPFLVQRQHEAQEPKHTVEEVKRARSMGNLTRQDTDDAEESALVPRSRKSSQTHAYVPPQQSRTQQKLWLQRASSNIEPQQMAPGVPINGLNGIHGGLGGTTLVGAGYDGRDPRIKIQLERTGLEYLVVRRHQDPIGAALKRLEKLPGVDKNRRIPAQNGRKSGESAGAGPYGLSQSLKESRSRTKDKTASNGARSSYEAQSGSLDEASDRGDDESVSSILRSLWEKSFDLSASTD